jgi:hypothetical protein
LASPHEVFCAKAGADSESTRVAALAMAGKRFSMRKLL